MKISKSSDFLFCLALLLAIIWLGSQTASGQCETSPSGIVAWWPLDGNPNDIVGTNNPSNTNLISFVSGEVGLGVTFANGGYIDIPDSAELENQTFSFVAWAMPNGPGPGGLSEDNSVLICKVNANVPYTADGYILYWNPNSHFYFRVRGNGNHDIQSADAFPAGSFYHVAGTYDGTNISLYVNGKLEAQLSSPQTIIHNSSIPWTIGANTPFLRAEGYLDTWNGVIDEVAIFNRALSSNEVAAIYAAGTAGMCKGPSIINQPISQTVCAGQGFTFTAQATGYPAPAYQWQFSTNGSTWVNISGATGPVYSLNTSSLTNVGYYQAAVSNPAGTVNSASASLTLLNINMYAGLNIVGPLGANYNVQSIPALNASNWTTLTNVSLPSQPYIYIDYSSPTNSKQFYRAVPQ